MQRRHGTDTNLQPLNHCYTVLNTPVVDIHSGSKMDHFYKMKLLYMITYTGWQLVWKTWKCQGIWQLSGKCRGFY